MQVARQMPPPSDLEARVRELVDKEERLACRKLRKRGWGRWLLIWVGLFVTVAAATSCAPKMYDWVKAVMIRASQISWGDSTAPPAKTPDNSHIIGQLTAQIAEMNAALAQMQQKYAEIHTKNETLAAELASMAEETNKKIRELEGMVEILGKRQLASPKPRKNVPAPLILTEPEGPRNYHAPTMASQEKTKSAYVVNKDGQMVRTDEL